jgi:hypothetical protein
MTQEEKNKQFWMGHRTGLSRAALYLYREARRTPLWEARRRLEDLADDLMEIVEDGR